MALDAEKRIPDTTLPANSFKDGDILYGSDMNRVVDTLKTAVNENYKDLKGVVKSGDSIYINPIEGVVDAEGQPINTVDGLIKWLYDNKVLNEGKVHSLRINDSKQFEYYDGKSWNLATVGQQGDPGEGVPTGGLSGQFLRKSSNVSYDTEWVDAYDKSQVDSFIASIENRLYKVNDGENTINANGGSIRGIKLYGRSLQDGTPTPDNPIEIQSVVNPKLKVCGKNLVDKSIFTFSNQRIFSQTFLEILPNTNYTFSVSNANGTDGVISIYDNDKNLINTYIQNASNPLLLSITTPSNAKYLRIDQWYIGIISSIDDIDIQLELGTVATDYEPYKEQTATLTYTLNAIPVSSGGNITIDGQQYIADYVDIDKKQLVRNVYKETFSSSSKIGESAVSNRYFFEFSPIKKVNLYINKLISNKYEFESDANIAWTSSKTTINIQPSGNIRLYDYNDTVSSDVIYPLATPITIDLTDEEVQAFKSLHTYEGVTNIIDSSEQISGSHKFIYNIADVIDNQCENIDNLNQLKPVTLGTSWTQDTTNGYYTQSIICSGINSKDNPTVDVVLSGTLAEMQAQQEDWGKILKVETSTDILKFYASEPTTVSLSVMVKGV